MLKTIEIQKYATIPTQISISNEVVTINPNTDLQGGSDYYIIIDTGAFIDSNSLEFAGIANPVTWNFTTIQSNPPNAPVITATAISDTEIEFDAKILLQDFYKIMGIDDHYFDENKGEADTLAGLILEIKGEIPEVNEIATYNDFEFKIIEVDNRRIKKILCKIIKNEE